MTDRRRGWAYGTTDEGKYLTIAGSAHQTPHLADTPDEATPRPPLERDRDDESRVVLAHVEEVPGRVTLTGLAYRILEVRPRTHVLDVQAANGVPFRVLAYEQGAYRHDPEHRIVEFYDRRYPHTQHGQFTGGQYRIGDLIARPPRGLMLNMGIPDWTVDAHTMARVMEWLSLLDVFATLGGR